MSDVDRAYYLRNRERLLAQMKERRDGKEREKILAQKREHYERNRESILQQQREHYQNNKDRRLEYGKKYRENNAEIIRQRKADYRVQKAEHIAEKKRLYYAANRYVILADRRANTSLREYDRRYKAENKEKMAARAKAYREENAEVIRARRRQNQPLQRERKRFSQNRRKARKVGNGGSHTYDQWIALCEQHNHRCVYCGSNEPLSEDHKTPLSRGGTDGIENIAPSCKPCNFSKGSRTVEEFLAWRSAIATHPRRRNRPMIRCSPSA